MADVAHATGSARKGMAQDARMAAQSIDGREASMIYSHVPPARVPLHEVNGLGEPVADWIKTDALAWTHMIDSRADDRGESRRADLLYGYRLAVIAVEALAPEATSHLAHLRDMARIIAQGIAWAAEHRMLRFTRDGADTVGLPMHGPVSEPISDYAERADNYAALAARMRERVERMRQPYDLAACYLVDEQATSWPDALVGGPFASYGDACKARADINIGDDCNVYSGDVLNAWAAAGHIKPANN